MTNAVGELYRESVASIQVTEDVRAFLHIGRNVLRIKQ